MKINSNADCKKCFKIRLEVEQRYCAKTAEFQPSNTFSECGSSRNTVPQDVPRRRLHAHKPRAALGLQVVFAYTWQLRWRARSCSAVS